MMIMVTSVFLLCCGLRRRVTQMAMVAISWGIPLVVIVVAVSIDRILNVKEIPFDVTILINSLSFMSFEVIF